MAVLLSGGDVFRNLHKWTERKREDNKCSGTKMNEVGGARQGKLNVRVCVFAGVRARARVRASATPTGL